MRKTLICRMVKRLKKNGAATVAATATSTTDRGPVPQRGVAVDDQVAPRNSLAEIPPGMIPSSTMAEISSAASPNTGVET